MLSSGSGHALLLCFSDTQERVQSLSSVHVLICALNIHLQHHSEDKAKKLSLEMCLKNIDMSDELRLLDYTCSNYHNLQRAEGILVRHLRFQVNYSVLLLPSNNRII